MRQIKRMRGLLCALAMPAALAAGLSSAAADPLRDAIAARLATSPRGMQPTGEALRAVYEERGYAPIWLRGSRLTATGQALLDVLGRAADDGLEAASYRLPPQPGRSAAETPETAAAFELALSASLLRYARDVRLGRVPPSLRYHGVAPVAAEPPAATLRRVAAASRIDALIADLAPRGSAYRRLREALMRYRAAAAASGWPKVPVLAGGISGASASAVAALRRRLKATGDLPPGGANPAAPDKALVDGLKRFQRRHGLAPTGTIDAPTRAALNLPVEARIATIALNLERLRWIPDEPADRVVVNAAGFHLDAIRGGKIGLSSRVIVGTCHQQTPQFATWMTGVQFNPYWYVPAGIANREILPRLRRDPGYLARNGYSVLTRNGTPVDPARVDWKSLKYLPYQLRQQPGPGNALGRIRFLMPNPHNVYLHDTPAKRLFERRRRAFSHGCVRVARPAELAAFLLAGQPGWDLAAVRRAAAAKPQRQVLFAQPVPVFVAYYTAWVARDGTVQFRDDIYGRDRKLAAALRRVTPRR